MITDEDFGYALISVKMITRDGTAFPEMIMEDIGWLNVQLVHNGNDEGKIMIQPSHDEELVGHKRKRDDVVDVEQQFQPQLRLR